MDRGKVTLEERPLGATIQRWFPAPPELVYRNWIEAEQIRHWFATDGYEVTGCEIDARPGGKWRVDFRSSTGHVYFEHGEFREMVPGRSLVLTLTQVDGAHTGPETLMTVTFEASRGGTDMTFRQVGYDNSLRRDGNAEGWQECFDKLVARLTSSNVTAWKETHISRHAAEEQEVRALFADWLRTSSALDIDGAMRPLDPDIHSYEHLAPLQYRGIDAIREVCRQGFDLIKGEFEWDIPDLQVIVRDDIAIAWGLNRMRYRSASAPVVENWSRSTRVFQKKDGQWKMIHQHLSVPADPKTGQARFDLKP